MSGPRRTVYCDGPSCGWKGKRLLHAEPKPCPRCRRIVYIARNVGGRPPSQSKPWTKIYFYPPTHLEAALRARARADRQPLSRIVTTLLQQALQ